MIYCAHRGHIPVCFRGIFNERLNALSAQTEHTIADIHKEGTKNEPLHGAPRDGIPRRAFFTQIT